MGLERRILSPNVWVSGMKNASVFIIIKEFQPIFSVIRQCSRSYPEGELERYLGGAATSRSLLQSPMRTNPPGVELPRSPRRALIRVTGSAGIRDFVGAGHGR